jgi:hypothetical protein
LAEIKLAFMGKCAICGIEESVCKQKLCMDHNHTTGKFRGWLCHKCNSGIGSFDDNPHLLEKAASWLREHPL